MVIYDFLYLDMTRIESFYAQFFHGVVRKTTRSSTVSTSSETAKGLGYSKTYGETRGRSLEQEVMATEVDPKEIIIIDTLDMLSYNAKDIDSAKNGEIIKIDADIQLIDKTQFDLILPNISHFMMMDAPKNKHKEIKKTSTMIKKVFESIRFDPLVYASMSQGVALGVIKEEFLRESIASFHIKHGGNGLSDMSIIGIKEEKALSIKNPEDSIIGGAMDISSAIKGLVVPEDAVIFSPIAIYRSISLDLPSNG